MHRIGARECVQSAVIVVVGVFVPTILIMQKYSKLFP